MAHMTLYVTPRGELYSADCSKCGDTEYTHEWANDDHNERRDAMQSGTLRCDHCGGRVDPDTFASLGKQYAGRYSADSGRCTDWHYDTNMRRLARGLKDVYGEPS